MKPDVLLPWSIVDSHASSSSDFPSGSSTLMSGKLERVDDEPGSDLAHACKEELAHEEVTATLVAAVSDGEAVFAKSMLTERLNLLRPQTRQPAPSEAMMPPSTLADLASLEVPACNESSESSAEAANPSDDEGIRDLLDDTFDEAIQGNFALDPRSGCLHVCSVKGSTMARAVSLLSDKPEAEESSFALCKRCFPNGWA
eukprot:5008250-Amphidinium_carterae.2